MAFGDAFDEVGDERVWIVTGMHQNPLAGALSARRQFRSVEFAIGRQADKRSISRLTFQAEKQSGAVFGLTDEADQEGRARIPVAQVDDAERVHLDDLGGILSVVADVAQLAYHRLGVGTVTVRLAGAECCRYPVLEPALGQDLPFGRTGAIDQQAIRPGDVERQQGVKLNGPGLAVLDAVPEGDRAIFDRDPYLSCQEQVRGDEGIARDLPGSARECIVDRLAALVSPAFGARRGRSDNGRAPGDRQVGGAGGNCDRIGGPGDVDGHCQIASTADVQSVPYVQG